MLSYDLNNIKICDASKFQHPKILNIWLKQHKKNNNKINQFHLKLQ